MLIWRSRKNDSPVPVKGTYILLQLCWKSLWTWAEEKHSEDMTPLRESVFAVCCGLWPLDLQWAGMKSLSGPMEVCVAAIAGAEGSLWKVWVKRGEPVCKSWSIFIRKSEVEKKHQSRLFLTQLLNQGQICHWCVLRKYLRIAQRIRYQHEYMYCKLATSREKCCLNNSQWICYSADLYGFCLKKINKNSPSLPSIQIALQKWYNMFLPL